MIPKILIGILFFFFAVNYAVDLFFFLKNRYCRFHIGRWSQEAWETSVEKKARKWLKHTPTVKITDNNRYILLDLITGKYRSHTIQSWQTAALILGLWESADPASKAAAKQAAAALLDKDGNWKTPPVAVDCGMLSYAILKTAPDPQKVRPAMEFSRSVIERSINEDGMIAYTGGKENPEMYVDTLGLTCAFLALYAKTYGVPSCEAIAFRQLQMYHDLGCMPGTNLPNHAFHMKTKLPLGVYGWGRGIAWYTIGLMDTYAELENEQYRQAVQLWIREAAESFVAYQRDDGGFGPIVQRNNFYDSSATAALAWFYGRCYGLFGETKYLGVYTQCLNILLKKTRISGAIDFCQGDTKDIGVFSQTYDIMPFAQGMAVRAINLSKNRK